MRVLGAVVLAVVLCWAWDRVALLLLDGSQLGYFTVWAVEGALIALAARIAGRWRWVVAVPLLLILVGGTAAMFGMLGLLGPGEYTLPAGVVIGALFGMLVIGPAILAPAVRAPNGRRLPVPAVPPQPRPRGFRPSALATGLAVLGVLLVIILVQVRVGQRQLEQVRRDVLPAVEDLARTDVLAHSGPVVWQGPAWGGGGRWFKFMSGRPMLSARGLMSGTEVRLSFIGHPSTRQFGGIGEAEAWSANVGLLKEVPTRQFGSIGEAEGLRVNQLVIAVPQPRALTDQEVKDPQVVKALLVSIGLRPELVSRLEPPGGGGDPRFYFARRNGVRYMFELNREWELGKGNYYVHIFCNGVRSAASP